MMSPAKISLSKNSSEILKKALSETIKSTIKNNTEKIIYKDESQTVQDWYKETKKESKKIPIIFINKLIEELTATCELPFINMLTEKVSFKIQENPENIKFDANILFKSLKPYVEFVKIVNETETYQSIRFTFQIDISGNLEGIKLNTSPISRSITIDKMSCIINILLIKISFTKLHEPIQLYNNNEKLKVENLVFNL